MAVDRFPNARYPISIGIFYRQLKITSINTEIQVSWFDSGKEV